jgi:guanine deaminase
MNLVVVHGHIVNPVSLSDVRILRDHSIGFNADSGRIEFVCARSELDTTHGSLLRSSGSVRVIDAIGKFVTPGLIDTHCHGPQYRNAGLGTDCALLEWLSKYTFPTEAKFASLEFARDVYNKVVRRSLRNGTTTVSYFATLHAAATIEFADIVRAHGQRALVGKVCMDRNAPPFYVEPSAAQSLADTVRVLDHIDAMRCPTVRPVLTPRFVPTCSSELMRGLGALARERRVFVQSHISENRDEVQWVAELHPDCASYADVYHRHGLLNDRSIMAHAIHLSDAELALFRSSGAAISHCANSNFNLCSGVLDVRRVLDAGVKVGLGTDLSGGYAPSMWDAIRSAVTASTVHAIAARSTKRLTYNEAFFLATLGGAQALSMADLVGSFEVGKQFDALIIDAAARDGPIDAFADYTVEELWENVLLRCDDRNIEAVFVDGKKVAPKER